MVYVLFVVGFVILIAGANILVTGASSVGKHFKMSSLVIGATIVALGTSLPELIINVFASVRGQTDLAITNVMGSNIMNTLLIIGITAMILPIIPGRKVMRTIVPISLIASLVLGLLVYINLEPLAAGHVIDFLEGLVLLALLIGYLLFTYFFIRKTGDEAQQAHEIKEYALWKSMLMIVVGVAGLYFGGNWVVKGAVHVAESFGMSQALVGITIVAVATSLPELITSVLAAMRKNSDIAIGNALGSNVFNIFLILGVSAMINPLPFSATLSIDLWVMILSNLVVVFFVWVGRGKKITRLEGALMASIYVAYIIWLLMTH
ncbi:MAG TPA: calcium/sodium antiporter [Bacteroidales bacterium]|nr:calcium/sodium antiporter [Bacteroidales bacterium]